MLGFQPYETFELLIESGGADRANTLLIAACDAYARRGRSSKTETEQFEALAERLFPLADATSRAEAALTLGKSDELSAKLEKVVFSNLGSYLNNHLEEAPHIMEATCLDIIASGDSEQCALLASRHDMSTLALTRLFQMNSRKVYRALALNHHIRPRGAFLSALARAAQMDHLVATSLAARADFDTALLAPAFFDLPESNRIAVIEAFALRNTPDAPIKRTIEQISVATDELTVALMKLFSENRRPEVTRLMTQITGLDEIRCGQIAHDTSGAALFVVLRAFGITAQKGLKVLIHATNHDEAERSDQLASFAKLFANVSSDSMAYLLSAWRGEINLLDLSKPQYAPYSPETRQTHVAANADGSLSVQEQIEKTRSALERIGTRRAG